MKFKEKLKKIRKEKGLTQSQLAKKSNISISAIKKYEIGLIEPNIETVNKLANALKINPIELTESISQLKKINKLNIISSVYDLFDNESIFYGLVQGITKMPYILTNQYNSIYKEGEESELFNSRIQSLSLLLSTINEYLKCPNKEDGKYIQIALNELLAVDGIKIDSRDK